MLHRHEEAEPRSSDRVPGLVGNYVLEEATRAWVNEPEDLLVLYPGSGLLVLNIRALGDTGLHLAFWCVSKSSATDLPASSILSAFSFIQAGD